MKILLAVGLALTASLVRAETLLSLPEVLSLAQQTDPWQQASRLRQESLAAAGVAESTWMDPRVSLSAANFPTDTFDANQEPMTQWVLGVSQMLPRGNTNQLKQQQKQAQSEQQLFMQENRSAELELKVTGLWLDAWISQRTIDLIEADRNLFENLVDVAQASYSSALAKTRQQDLVRAQLELLRLEDRLEMLRGQRDKARGELNQWLPSNQAYSFSDGIFKIPEQLPDIQLREAAVLELVDRNALAQRLGLHPMLQKYDQAIEVENRNVDIARQQYKPQWGISAAYGYRDDDPAGRDRADFFSAGVSVDLPIFTGKRQDKQLQAAKSSVGALRTDRDLALRQFLAAFETSREKLHRIKKRYALYSGQLLEQADDQAEAALTAYTNDEGDFAEVVRARIAEINARIEALNIQVEKLKTIAQLNYFLVQSQQPLVAGGAQQ